MRDSIALKNGEWLQNAINNAELNEVIILQPTVFRFHSLVIDKPVRIQGQAGTVFEVFGGSIIIDFRESCNN